jgi:hypothetical protein
MDELRKPAPSIQQLPPDAAAAFMKQMYARSRPFKTLIDTFSSRGLQFFFERSKVFLYANALAGPKSERCDDSDDQPFGLSANLMGIIPSFVTARACDDQHLAVGIVVHGAGGAVATSVEVQHRPFQVARFTLHEPNADGIHERSVTTAELATLSVDAIAERLGKVTVRPEEFPPNSAPPSVQQREQMIAASLEQILADPFAAPLYRPEGPGSLLAQLPLIQKFSAANAARFTSGGGGFDLCLATSSSCCNGCTTTSFILDLSARSGAASA